MSIDYKLSSAVDQPKGSVKVRRGLWMLLIMSVVLGNILEFLLEVMVIVDDLMTFWIV